jgi:hypothetical protein
MVGELCADGAPPEWLRRCMDAGRPVLLLIAVCERHPERAWRPSVYEIAHRRLRR